MTAAMTVNCVSMMATSSGVLVAATVSGRIGGNPHGQMAPGSKLSSVHSSHRVGNALKCSSRKAQQHMQQRFVVTASSLGGKDLYQPFRPPPTVAKETPAGAQNVEEMLQILRDKQGMWYSYASVLPALTRLGYSPSEIDEATGINGHEQNALVVGAQVRASIVAAGFDKELISWFDSGAETLYELRTLSAQQRRASAEFIISKNLDPKGARELARAVKDFERRRGVEGWEAFSPVPGDCLALSLLRQSKDAKSRNELETLINKALEYAETESARRMLERVLGSGEIETVEEEVAKANLIVMRLDSDEVPIVLPVCDFSAKSVIDAPAVSPRNTGPGSFQVFKTNSPWKSYVSIPGWKPIRDAAAPVGILIIDASVIPKKVGIKSNTEPILVVVDKGDKTVDGGSFYLVGGERGVTFAAGAECSSPNISILGRALIALRPPLLEEQEEPSWE